MATETKYKYHKVCLVCNGMPWKIIPNSGERYLLIFQTPNKIEICNNCCGLGYIAPKKIIHFIDTFKDKVIY